MKAITLCILLVLAVPTFGQEEVILTTGQNKEWFSRLSNLPLTEQPACIAKRILSDTCVDQRWPAHCRFFGTANQWPAQNSAHREIGDGKPLFILNGKRLRTKDSTCTEQLILASGLIETISIKKIKILAPFDPNAMALYGGQSKSGVVVLILSKARDLKKFKELIQ